MLFIFSTLALAASGGSGDAVFRGAEQAVEFCIGIAGGICLWSGVMELTEQCGLARALGRLLKKPLSRLFPASCRDEQILSALSQNISANLLGLGNAATPAGIRAAQGMAALGSRAQDELCMLVVLNTASIQLIPATVAGVRSACGSAAPFDILPAVWLASVLSVSAGLLASWLLSRVWRD